MFRFMITLILAISLLGCASPVAATPTVATKPPLQFLIPSEWAGATIHADGTTDPITVQLTHEDGVFNIEPFTKSYKIEKPQYVNATVSFNITNQREMRFSGEFDDS